MAQINYRSYVPLLAFILLLVLSFFVIKPFLVAIFFGGLLAYIFYPLYDFLTKKIRGKTISALLICLLIIVIIIVPGFFFVKALIQESYVIFLVIKQKLAIGVFTGCENSFCGFIENLWGDPDIQFQIQEIGKAVTNWVIEKGSELLASIPGFLLNLFIMLFTMFYFLKDGKPFLKKLARHLLPRNNDYSGLLKKINDLVHGLVFGYLLVALIQGTIGAIAFFVLGISSPIFWGVMMALFALIPFIGTGIIWAPASIIMFLEGIFLGSNVLVFKGVGLFIFGLVVIGGVDNILRPKMMGDKAKIHPAIVLLGIFGGTVVFGPLGVIIGPFILSLTMIAVKAYLKK
tara:strand:- start:350 stop:1384 length:1035 start_codon:yes stop_codon:yes gene_type:complete